MRKRTVKNLCKEIFWHIVYFLPIVIALFSMLLFTTENYASYIVSADQSEITEDDITDLTDTTWIFDDQITFGYGEYEVFFLVFESNLTEFSSLTFVYDYNGDGGSQILYQSVNDRVDAYDSAQLIPWINNAYKKIRFIGGSAVQNLELIEKMRSIATLEPIFVEKSTHTVYDLMSDALNSSFDVMGLNFENDYLYNALSEVFVNGGILAVFKDVSVLLKFATYYFYVHIIHLFIDAILFIPKLAHKWIDRLTRCE